VESKPGQHSQMTLKWTIFWGENYDTAKVKLITPFLEAQMDRGRRK